MHKEAGTEQSQNNGDQQGFEIFGKSGLVAMRVGAMVRLRNFAAGLRQFARLYFGDIGHFFAASDSIRKHGKHCGVATTTADKLQAKRNYSCYCNNARALRAASCSASFLVPPSAEARQLPFTHTSITKVLR